MKKLISIFFSVMFLFAFNFNIFAVPPGSPLTIAMLAILQRHFSERNVGEHSCISFPDSGGERRFSHGTMCCEEIAPSASDFRVVNVYNFPYMLNLDGENGNDFLKTILSLYLTSREEMQKIYARHKHEGNEIERVKKTFSDLVETLNNRFLNDPSLQEDVRNLALIMGVSRPEAFQSYSIASIYFELANKFSARAVKEGVNAVISGVVGGIATAGGITAALITATVASAATANPVGIVVAVVLGVGALASFIVCGISKSNEKEALKNGAKAVKDMWVAQRVQNDAKLLRQIYGFFVNHHTQVRQSNVLITAVDRRIFSCISDKDTMACKDLRNDEAWSDFARLDLQGAPIAEGYVSPTKRKVDFLIQLFQAATPANADVIINHELLRQYADGRSLPLSVRTEQRVQVEKMLRRGMSSSDIAEILGTVTEVEVEEFWRGLQEETA